MLYKDVDLFLKWLAIREENGIPLPTELMSLTIDAHKSALLRRMLSGKQPFPIPPPKAFSYPWYDLIEKGWAEPFEVYEPTGWAKGITGYPALVIDQSPWLVINKISDEEWIVTYMYGHFEKQERAPGQWHVYCVGSRLPRDDSKAHNKLWKIEKIE